MTIFWTLGRTLILCLIVLQACLVFVQSDYINFPTRRVQKSTVGGVFPIPQKQELKDQYVGMVETFSLRVVGKSCDILENAILRYTNILKTNWRNLTKYDLANSAPSIVGKTRKLKIRLLNDCEKYPHLGMDEKYVLIIKDSSSLLESASIWGILRGLETFSQLPVPSANGEELLIQIQTIEDFPQFPHRGLLLDTSRHYLPVKTLKKQLDIMAYNKMNVLHWHMVDDQSFPYESKKFPELSRKGAFGPDAVYTEDMIASVVEYARLRGIRVIPELDTPGHTDSMEPGRPDLHCHCTYRGNKTFVGPMDPTKNTTLDFARELFTEVGERFPEKYLHMGGDEVDYFCWQQNKDIQTFMKAKNWNGPQLQSYYMQNVLKVAKNISKTAIVWEEVFMNWKNLDEKVEKTNSITMDKDTIVQVWRGSSMGSAKESVKKVVAAGFKVINSVGWYLDSLEKDFDQFTEIDFSAMGLSPEEMKLVMGGETCMWGEKVDETNLESRVWPRACAAAEHLWSAPGRNETHTIHRITEHVCRLRRRNVLVSPAYDISYCSAAIPQPSNGWAKYGRYLSVSGIRQSLGLDADEDEEEKFVYETVHVGAPAAGTPLETHVSGVVAVSHTEKPETIHPAAYGNSTATLSRVTTALLCTSVVLTVKSW